MMLSIRNFAVDCRLSAPADTAHARDVLDRTLSAIRKDVPGLLQRALAAEDDRCGIAFIERLEFDALIATEWSEDDIGREIGRQVLRSLWGKLADCDTTRFTGEAERLARFLIDVADGAAFTRGWHRSFDGLKLLSGSAIVRTLIERDARVAIEALSRLGRANSDRIAGCMDEGNGRRALAAIVAAADKPCRDLKALAQALATAGPIGTFARRIAFAVALFQQTGTTADAVALRLADVLFALAQTGLAVSAEEAVRSAAAPDEWAENAAVVAALQRDLGALPDAIAILDGIATASVPESVSRHGGVWLLVPYMLNLAPALALAALALAAGAEARDVWHDAVLRDALAVPPHDEAVVPTLGNASARHIKTGMSGIAYLPSAVWRRDLAHLNAARAALGFSKTVARLPMRAAAQALRRYADRLPGFAQSSFPYLWRNLLGVSAAIRTDKAGIAVALSPPSLDPVWRLSGAGNADFRLADGRRVVVEVRR